MHPAPAWVSAEDTCGVRRPRRPSLGRWRASVDSKHRQAHSRLLLVRRNTGSIGRRYFRLKAELRSLTMLLGRGLFRIGRQAAPSFLLLAFAFAFPGTSAAALKMRPSPPAEVKEFRLPEFPSATNTISPGPEGDMWFSNRVFELNKEMPPYNLGSREELDRISPTGEITTVASPFSLEKPVTNGPGGFLWTADEPGLDKARIAQIGASGELTQLPPTKQGSISTLAYVDEEFWYLGERVPTDYRGDSGEELEYFLDHQPPGGPPVELTLSAEFGCRIEDMAVGPEGDFWIADRCKDTIFRISQTGQVARFPVSGEGLGGSVALGQDGNLWFPETGEGIGRITPSGTITIFPFPIASQQTYGGFGEKGWGAYIIAGPDGRLWFAYGEGAVGLVTTSGAFSIVRLPSKTAVRDLAVGKEGEVWYTAASEGACHGGGGSCEAQVPHAPGIVGRLTPAARAVEFRSSVYISHHGRRAGIEIGCVGGNGSDPCFGVVRLSRAGKIFRRRAYLIPADQQAKVVLRLTPAVRHSLEGRHHLRVAIHATVETGRPIRTKAVLRS
jgi:hypothetical protein